MPTGTVKWFNEDKRFGFITPDEGDKDLFVHQTGIADGARSLPEGARSRSMPRTARRVRRRSTSRWRATPPSAPPAHSASSSLVSPSSRCRSSGWRSSSSTMIVPGQ